MVRGRAREVMAVNPSGEGPRSLSDKAYMDMDSTRYIPARNTAFFSTLLLLFQRSTHPVCVKAETGAGGTLRLVCV